MKKIIIALITFFQVNGLSQGYTSYFTGNTSDVVTNPAGGICLMGGATEHDEAMKWFLLNSNGGDILVLRASGSNGYNNYLYSGLGVTVNSVETIVFNDGTAANSTYVQQKIKQAEAIWFAGGDQWNYISYWRNNKIDSLINDGLINRHIVIGGTSAGMAIQGKFYFSASNGSITSAAALINPYNASMTIDSISFLKNKFLENVITDTHYDNPDRRGRHTAFLARIYKDWGIEAKGIACDEYTAVCIDTFGIAHCYGDYPSYDEDIYFLQTNCEINPNGPENCQIGNPLEWNQNGEAVKVYRVKGTMNGANTFSLIDWQTGSGGVWENWHIENGTFYDASGNQPSCSPISLKRNEINDFVIFPNPINNGLLNIENLNESILSINITDMKGKQIKNLQRPQIKKIKIDVSEIEGGFYFLEIKTTENVYTKKLLID